MSEEKKVGCSYAEPDLESDLEVETRLTLFRGDTPIGGNAVRLPIKQLTTETINKLVAGFYHGTVDPITGENAD